MVAAVLCPDQGTVKLFTCKRCRARRDSSEFGLPVRSHRVRDDFCHSCRAEIVRGRAHWGRCSSCGCGMDFTNGKRGWVCPGCATAEKRRRRGASRSCPARAAGAKARQHGIGRCVPDAVWDALAKRNARQAWDHWIDIAAPERWLGARAEFFRNCDRERWRINSRSYHLANPQRERARKQRRRGRLVTYGDGTADPASVQRLLDQAAGCAYCGIRLDNAGKTLDHMQPLALGGAHSLDNLLVACLACNAKKGAMPFLRWLDRLPEPRRRQWAELHRQCCVAP
jgi:5-methylcytosine-specific restriction endonuclease McrA